MKTVRIVGTGDRFIKDGRTYIGWEVQTLNDDGEWTMVAIAFGPASCSAAISTAQSWRDDKVPSPVESTKFKID